MRRWCAVLACLLVAVAGCGEPAAVVTSQNTNPDGYHAILLPKPYQVTGGKLTDDEGEQYRFPQDVTKPLTLVFFGYTNCDDVCRIIMTDLTAAVARLDPALQDEVGMLFVTSDPERDDPQTLDRYLGRYNPDFVGLTGALATITAIAESVGVLVEKGEPLPSGGYDVGHGSYVIGLRSDGTAPLVWDTGTSSKEFAEDITQAFDTGVAQVGS
ncbi:MAG TPA: SCO family protein [Nocardioidaceae bacterium]|nr:SCO family protein [Nocardioidaceae bacterium]